jgi:murein L,D-transpeptidase YcbB/YkuD
MLGRAVILAAGTLMISGVAVGQTADTPTSLAKAEAHVQSQAEARVGTPGSKAEPLAPSEVQGPPPDAPAAIVPAMEPAALTSPSALPEALPAASANVAPDPVLIEVRRALAAPRGRESAADAADRAALAAFYAGETAAIQWTDAQGFTGRGESVMAEIRKADDWGLRSSAFDLPAASGGLVGAEARADAEIKIGLAILEYARHARGGRVDPLSLSDMYDRRLRVFEPGSLIKAAAASREPDRYLRDLHPKHAGFHNLQKALVIARAAAAAPQVASPEPETEPEARPQRKTSTARPSRPPSAAETIARIVSNMERWRWMPDDLGKFHVWNNLPEQMTVVFNDGNPVFTERVIVGKPDTATPNFTANMQFIVFQPEWGVPPGIKNNEIGPLLRRASAEGNNWFSSNGRTPSSVLARQGLRVSVGGRVVNPDSINWSAVDINRFDFIQPAGKSNVLGVAKFLFPNKHHVYMHDTPHKHLFGSATRTYSYGCIRVRDPIRFAEVLLGHDKGWSPERVRSMVPRGGQVTLSTPIPVHTVYFTAVADADGKLRTFSDFYRVDSRVASAIEGRTVAVASRGQAPAAEQAGSGRVAQRVKGERKQAERRTTTASASNPFAGLFGN